ncbi:MAG: hypothetical protein SGPRY_007072, partial [Prymnesium sp.]
VVYALDWNYYFISVAADAELDALLLSIGEGSCAQLRSGNEVSSVSNALVETTGRQTYRATLLPRPELLNLQDGTCNELTPSSRDFVIGVYGAVTSATAQGISIELGVSVQPRTLSVGVSRNVAILGGSYSAFLLPVENGKAFSTSATVTQYTGDTNDRRKALRTTVAISVSECSQNQTAAEQWYLVIEPFRVEVGHFVEVDLFTSFTDKQFQATAVTTGEVLQQQWNHFFLQSAQQGAATTPPHLLTRVSTPPKPYNNPYPRSNCWDSAGNCPDPATCVGDECDQRLFLYAEQGNINGGGTCPTTTATHQGATQYSNTGLRLDTTICTESNSIYSVALRGGIFPASRVGGSLEYQITSVSRDQTNLASLSRGSSLLMSNIQRNGWEYHYFEMPDPPSNSLTYPAELLLEVSPVSAGAALSDVNVEIRFLGCGTPAVYLDPTTLEQEGVTRSVSGSTLNIIISAAKLKAEYDRQLSVNRLPPLPAGCLAEDVSTCSLAQTTGGRVECCFNPKIYIAIEGQMAQGLTYDFQLKPQLLCQPGYRAGEGTTYGEACTACVAGKYTEVAGSETCASCLEGKFQNESGTTGCLNCAVGHECPDRESISMTPCVPGKHSPSQGAEQCSQCAVGKFANFEGAVDCDFCPEFTTTASTGKSSVEIFGSEISIAINTPLASQDDHNFSHFSLRVSEAAPQQAFSNENYYSATLAWGVPCSSCEVLQTAICPGGQAFCANGAPGCGYAIPVTSGTEYLPLVIPQPQAGFFQTLSTDLLDTYVAGTDAALQLKDTIQYDLTATGQTPFYSCSLAESWTLFEQKKKEFTKYGQRSGDDPQLALLNTAPCSSCDNGNFAAQRYFRRDERCEACGNQTILIVLVLIFLIFLVILAYYASKTNFNFAAISISINFFQASAQTHPLYSPPPLQAAPSCATLRMKPPHPGHVRGSF